MSDTNKRIPNRGPTMEQMEAELSRVRYGGRYKRSLRATLYTLLTVVNIAMVLVYLFPALRITGASMAPTLQNGEIALAMRFSTIEKGDLVAFQYGNRLLVKRLIAAGGDVVTIEEDGAVVVNGEVLDEPYVSNRSRGKCDIDDAYEVPEGCYFLMGDDRTESIDSRVSVIGSVSKEQIIGKLLLRVWPFEKVGTISGNSSIYREDNA